MPNQPENPTGASDLTPSDRRAETARRNGAKSRGPKSAAGKANSARNALRHGLYAKAITLRTESRAEFLRLLSSLEDEFNPSSQTEHDLVTTMAYTRWRTRRAWRIETAVYEDAMESVLQTAPNQTLPAFECEGRTFRNLADRSPVLGMIDRAESRYQRHYHRALKDLLSLRLASQSAEFKNEQTNPATFTKQKQGAKAEPGPNPA